MIVYIYNNNKDDKEKDTFHRTLSISRPLKRTAITPHVYGAQLLFMFPAHSFHKTLSTPRPLKKTATKPHVYGVQTKNYQKKKRVRPQRRPRGRQQPRCCDSLSQRIALPLPSARTRKNRKKKRKRNMNNIDNKHTIEETNDILSFEQKDNLFTCYIKGSI